LKKNLAVTDLSKILWLSEFCVENVKAEMTFRTFRWSN